MSKICRICSIEKPLDQFRLQPSGKTYRTECIPCQARLQRERRLQRLPLTLEQRAARTRAAMIRRQAHIEEYRAYQREYQRGYRKRVSARRVQGGATGETPTHE